MIRSTTCTENIILVTPTNLEKTTPKVGRIRGFLRAAPLARRRGGCGFCVDLGSFTRDLGPLDCFGLFSGRLALILGGLPARPR